MDIDLPTNDNQRTDTDPDNTDDFNTHAQTNDKATEQEQHATLTNTNNNMDTLNNVELTDNTSLEMHEQTSKTIHTDQQKPCTCTSNANHLHTNSNIAHPNLTPHQNTNNYPQTYTNTHKNPDFLNIPPNLVTLFKIIYTLKLNKLQTNLIHLQEHKTTKTLPIGLRKQHKFKLYLNRKFSDHWEKTLTEASLALLDITLDHHKQCINNTKYKLQYRIQQLKLICNEDTALQIIEKTDSLFLKYTKRALINT